MTRYTTPSPSLRFPLIFGGFLGIVGIAFFYRQSWLGDIEVERDKIYKENMENRNILESLKNTHGKRF